MSFTTPGFLLAGLALAAIPIVIHLLNRRRYQIVQWAAMRYLMEAMRENRRRLRLESLLLLLARCAALALLCVALARPVGCDESPVASLIAPSAGLHVFVLDDSLSMQYRADRPDAKTNFDQAKRLVRQSLERLQNGSEQVAIVTASVPPAVRLQPTFDLDAATRALDAIQPSAGRDDMPGAIAAADAIADQIKGEPSRRLTILTDNTAASFADNPPLAAAAKKAAGRFKLELFALGQPNQSNRGVTALATGEPMVRLGFGGQLAATVRGFGNVGEQRLDWTLDDRPLPGGDAIRPEPSTPTLTNGQARFERAGPSVATVSFAGEADRLPADDKRYAVVNVVGDMNVLIVEGRRGLGALQGSGAFLRLALAPPVEAGVPIYVRPTTISDLELGAQVLEKYRATILAGAGGITDAAAGSLEKYVKRGGDLIVFVGDAVVGDEYNRALGARGLLPGTLVARIDSGAGKAFTFDFDPAHPHPVLNAFRNVEKSGLDTAQVSSYWRVQLDPERHAERVLSFRDSGGAGDPAITIQTVGRGRVVFVATTADAEWSSWVAKPAYVALMHELLAGAVGDSGGAWMNRAVGDTIVLPADVETTSVPQLREGRDRVTPMRQVVEGGVSAWQSEPIARPGLYQVEVGERKWPVAVNVPASESDVRTLDADGIKAALGNVAIELRGDALPTLAASRSSSDLAWPFLMILLPLLALESLMAWKFSRGKAA